MDTFCPPMATKSKTLGSDALAEAVTEARETEPTSGISEESDT